MAELLKELSVLNDVADIMRPLTKGEQRRIVAWIEDYFGIYDFDGDDFEAPTVVVTVEDEAPLDDADDLEIVDEEEEAYEEPVEAPEALTLESYFEQVAPKTAIQKIVTAAYWLDTEEDKATWKSFEVNKLLKSLGIKVSSVSGTLAIEAKKPDPMIVVLDKSSDSMQGRKTFRLSEAGMAFVENRLD